MEAAIADYREAAEAIALRVSRGAVAIQVGADQDDLTQEGLLSVWQALGRGVTPSAEIMEARMRDYIRFLGAQQGRGRNGEPLAYEAILPLEDFRGLEAARG